MYYVDGILTGERFRRLIRDISAGDFQSTEVFIKDFAEVAGEEYSDAIVHKLQTLCRLMIDVGAYEYVARILELDWVVGTYEDISNEGEECVLTYAIRKIDDEAVIASFMENWDGGEFVPFFFEYYSPSVMAVELKKYNTLKLLFEKKICDEKYGYSHWTVLQHAVCYQKYDLALFALTELKHNPDLYAAIDMTPLGLAVNINDFKMVDLLIKNGANPFATDKNGRTAAFYSRSEKMIELFRKLGVERENIQMGIISRIISDLKYNGYSRPDLVKSLLDYDEPLYSNEEENIILLAARYGDAQTLEILKDYILEVGAQEIIYAAFDSYLIDDISYKKDVDKLTELTDILINAGVSCGISDSLLSPYYTLANRPDTFLNVSNEKAFRLFDNVAKLGYKVTTANMLGQNVFHAAIESLNIPLIDYCLSKGMSYSALDSGDVSAIELLLNDNPVCRTFKEANIALIEKVLQTLIENGCDINYKNSDGNTPLHLIVNSRVFKEYPIKLAVKYNADLSALNNLGDTPYDIAVRRGVSERVLRMLEP